MNIELTFSYMGMQERPVGHTPHSWGMKNMQENLPQCMLLRSMKKNGGTEQSAAWAAPTIETTSRSSMHI